MKYMNKINNAAKCVKHLIITDKIILKCVILHAIKPHGKTI